MTDNWTERDKAQIEQVFALTGGELADEPWTFTDGDSEWTAHFWYEFPPEYVERNDVDKFGERFDSTAFSYRTMVRDIMFGEPPDVIEDKWVKVAVFRSSGETECPGRNEDVKDFKTVPCVFDEFTRSLIPSVRADQCNDGEECWYCEAKIGEAHGYIYLGDGWAEIVYREKEESE